MKLFTYLQDVYFMTHNRTTSTFRVPWFFYTTITIRIESESSQTRPRPLDGRRKAVGWLWLWLVAIVVVTVSSSCHCQCYECWLSLTFDSVVSCSMLQCCQIVVARISYRTSSPKLS